jgi:hypothetical protein
VIDGDKIVIDWKQQITINHNLISQITGKKVIDGD